VDVLSDAIAAMRMGQPHSSRTVNVAPWGVRVLPSDGAGFHVVLQGSCWLIPRDAPPIRLHAGDVVFLPNGRGHGLCDSLDTPLLDLPPAALLEFGDDQGPETPPDDDRDATVMLCGAYRVERNHVHPLMSELPDVVHLPARVGHHESLRATVELLSAELLSRRPGSDAIVTAFLDALLLYIVRTCIHTKQEDGATRGWAAAINDTAVHAALRCIHDDPTEAWTVASLGQRVGLSRAAFARRFTATTGLAPMSYLTWWRMVAASRRLSQSSDSMTDIATYAGYTSPFAFAKAFKRQFGIPPGQYRRQGNG